MEDGKSGNRMLQPQCYHIIWDLINSIDLAREWCGCIAEELLLRKKYLQAKRNKINIAHKIQWYNYNYQ